ncbi:MAG TPA: GlsB/YeaQ/YmgE family stress response membrane protein [Flavobacteriales bacterium]|jgi:uncharacterized membrane protein YeaQ/YmgE (transglycosylase-associated protein family)|nr:GlsB/YeaQ/YmgE family stress response membrane protein [Flavobacteriales bacterium]
MDWIWIILIGAVAGWLATRIMKSSEDRLGVNIVLGVLGSIVGGFVLGAVGLYTVGLIGRLVSATVGAILLIVLARAIRK